MHFIVGARMENALPHNVSPSEESGMRGAFDKDEIKSWGICIAVE